MRVIEEPFTTREAILAVLRPGQLPTEGPFRTLRQHGQASGGVRVDVRNRMGRLLGRTNLYSSLNADAARAARRNDGEQAQHLAAAAATIEQSSAATTVRQVIQKVAASVPAELDDLTASVPLRRYVHLRRESSPSGLDRDALVHAWIIRSTAWFDAEDQALNDAVEEISRETAKARAAVSSQTADWVSTFFGIVRRLDEFAAEICSESGSRLMPRGELDREGLAVIGQAVALLCEELPAGGSLIIPMPALAVKSAPAKPNAHPWDPHGFDEGARPGSLLERADYEWVTGQRKKQPTRVMHSALPKA